MIAARSTLRLSLALLVLSGLASVPVGCDRQKSNPTLHKHTIGIVTWVGYGPLFIAKDKGFFKAEGLDVDIKIMDGPGEREAAYLAGSLDLFPNTPDAFAIFAAQGAKGKLVMPMDESAGADGLVAKKSIERVADLKGKKVGFQSGITSHFFLLYLLQQAGLTGKDLIQENLGAGDAGAAFAAGKLDAAVTWEPWLTKSRELPDARVLATSKDTPGLLADVLMASESMMKGHRADVLAFMSAWFKAVDYMKHHEDECAGIISRAFKLEPAEVKDMLSKDHFFTIEESKAYFGVEEKAGKVAEVFSLAAKLYKENGVIQAEPDPQPLIDKSLLNELK